MTLDPVDSSRQNSSRHVVNREQDTKIQGSLLTIVVTVNLVDVGKQKNAACRIACVDGQSRRDQKPAARHGMFTFTKNATEQLDLPLPPKDIVVADQTMMSLGNHKNPFKYISWMWLAAAYGTCNRTATEAIDWIAKLGIALLQQGLFDVNMTVPKEVPAKNNEGSIFGDDQQGVYHSLWSEDSRRYLHSEGIDKCAT